jgi:hypothetical protein
MPTVTHLAPSRRAPFLALTWAVVVLGWPVVVRAAQYESDIVIDSESDLYALQERGDLSRESLEALVALLRSGVGLERARAEELHELPGITWRDVDAIIAARHAIAPSVGDGRAGEPPALGVAHLRRVAAFLRPRHVSKHLVRGSLELASHYTAGDPLAPPALLRGRLNLPAGLSLGFALVSTRQRLGSLSWDPARHAVVAQAPAYSTALPKFFLSWGDDRLSVFAGTFRIGFAERLTLDNTRRQTPHGFHADDVLQRDFALARFCPYPTDGGPVDVCGAGDDASHEATRDFRWEEGFRGLAASLREVRLGSRASVDLHAFASYQPRSIYQYEIFDRDRCVDPRADDEPCRAPPVLEANTGGPMTYVTLPDAFDEAAGGGHASLSLDGIARVGMTGYLAAPRWRIPGARIDFQESADYPSGGVFGAIGVDVMARAGAWRLSAEAARSFDRLAGGGGGFGAVQRAVLAALDRELELTLRYFDPRFVNPHARPVSAPDEVDGQRARNEAGARVRYWHQAGVHWRLAASADVWLAPHQGTAPGTPGSPKVNVSARGDFAGASPISLALWASHTRAPLILAEAACGAEPPSNEGCGRERSHAGARVAVSPLGPLAEVSLQCAYGWAHDARAPAPQQDVSVWMEATANLSGALRLRLRTHYVDAEITDDASSERSWATSLEAGWSPAPSLSARSRYEAYARLDGGGSTRARRRNPEHRFRLELETRF